MMSTPLCRLRRLPLSLESLRDSEGGRSRRGGAALAREPWRGPRQLLLLRVGSIAYQRIND
mgnify:CR=1 FL=1